MNRHFSFFYDKRYDRSGRYQLLFILGFLHVKLGPNKGDRLVLEYIPYYLSIIYKHKEVKLIFTSARFDRICHIVCRDTQLIKEFPDFPVLSVLSFWSL